MSEELQGAGAPIDGVHPMVEINATVNGRKVSRTVPNHYRLIDFVREELKLTGNKEGCGAGECGTCSMFVDGKLVKSCLTPVQKIQGAAIETVDDLDRDHGMTVLQRAFHKCGSSQCGYCIPGMVMAGTALLRRKPAADRDEIKQGLGGNICRCTGYQKILDAVELARDVINGDRPASALDEADSASFVGHSTRRLDAPGKVTGAIKYAADMWMANMLHMQVLRSPHPHARIVRIDASAARAMAGVECVLTSEDVPGIDNFGVAFEDQPVMARHVVRYVGEAVVAVAAQTLEIARAAVRSIQVDYELLPALFDPQTAMLAGAVQLHDFAPDNICKHTKIRKGDVEAGFKDADLVVEEIYQTAAIEHAYLEPEAGLAYLEADGCVTVESPSQNITHHRHMLARILGRPINKVRMIMSTVGGGFGGKEDMLYQGMLALAAIKTRRPVRYVFSREESFIASAKRHPFRISYKMGLKRDGRITATEMKMLSDGGAYAMSTPFVMNKSAILGPGPYAIPNVWVDAIGVYTNNTPSGAMRAFGAFQSEFSTEAHLDLCAQRLGMDPAALRRVNLMRDGATTHTRQQLDRVLATECLTALVSATKWDAGVPHRQAFGQPARSDLGGHGTRAPLTPGALPADQAGVAESGSGTRHRGRGIACGWYGIARTAAMDRAAVWVELDDGGTVKIATGVTEIGEGILTGLCQIAAQEMGVRPEDIVLGDNDTARVPEAAHAGATRMTYMIGNAVAIACREAFGKFRDAMGNYWGVAPDNIRAFAGDVWVEGSRSRRMSMAHAVHVLKKELGIVIVGSGLFTSQHTSLHPETGESTPWRSYVFGAQIAEVEVDDDTGEVQVLGVWAAHDVGRVINPQQVEGQIEGGVVMALGHALMEEYIQVEGQTSTPGFAKYILPTSVDVPLITSILIDEPDPTTPLGVKGIGEPAITPTAPAIINAIFDAVGVRITQLPATPERVMEALRHKRRLAAQTQALT